jgi:hypothetical protein
LEQLLQSAYDLQKRQQVLSKSMDAKNIPDSNALPWYERGSFWGCLSLAAAIVLMVIAAMQKDFRWLLLIAWPLTVVPIWIACKELKSIPTRWFLIILLSSVTAVGLI